MRLSLASTETEIRVAYDGDAVRAGSMDVRELAPALMAIGDLFQRANRLLNGDEKARVRVLVESDFKAGSFEIELQVITDWIGALKSILVGEDVKAATELAKILGFLKSGGISFLGLLKRLRGQKPKEVKPLPGGGVQLIFENHGQIDHLEVTAPVFQLYGDEASRAAARSIVRPVRQPGISEFRVLDGGEVVESVDSQEAEAFDEPPLLDAEIPGAPLIDSVRQALLELDRPSLIDDLEWTVSDGGPPFAAAMKDEAFRERVRRREVLFGAGDLLKVRLRDVTTRGPKGRLKTIHSIIEVLEVIPAQQQPRLPGLETP